MVALVMAVAVSIGFLLLLTEPETEPDAEPEPVPELEPVPETEVAPDLPEPRGLHFTPEELALWRERAVEGPYREPGDVSANSPGDWARIVDHKDRFLSDPTAGRYEPSMEGGCIPDDMSRVPPVEEGAYIRDAAFYALVERDQDTARAVIEELVAQAQLDNADFTDESRFCPQDVYGTVPYFFIAEWALKKLFAFDYVMEWASEDEQAIVGGWFLGAAEYMRPNMDERFDELWVDRWGGDYEPTRGADYGRVTHLGGPQTSHYGRIYNNRESTIYRFIGLVGVQQDDEMLKASAKQWVKDFVVAAVYPTGVLAEFERWTDELPDLGWAYSYGTLGHVVGIADALARIGDTELYDYVTSEGVYGTAGTPPGEEGKSLRFALESLAMHSDGTHTRYGTDDPSNANEDHRISGAHPADGSEWRGHHDVFLAQPNLYYESDYLKSIYMRTDAQVPDYWPDPSDSESHWQGSGWAYPGVLFMFGQMEGEVDPYPTR